MDIAEQTNADDSVNIKTELVLSEKKNVKFINKVEPITPESTPQKRIKGKTTKRAATTTRKKSLQDQKVADKAESSIRKIVTAVDIKTTAKKNSKSKEPPPSQLRIDKFFKSCTKSYKIDSRTAKDELLSSIASTNKKSKTIRKRGSITTKKNKGRKRLFKEEDECTTTVSTVSGFTNMTPTPPRNTRKRSGSSSAARGSIKKAKEKSKDILDILIDLISEDENEEKPEPFITKVEKNFTERTNYIQNINEKCNIQTPAMVSIPAQYKYSEKSIKSLKCKKIAKSESSDRTEVNSLTKNRILTETSPVSTKDGNINYNIANVQVIKKNSIHHDPSDLPCTTSALKKRSTRKKSIKVKTDAELLCATPPSPPQTTTDTFSSNCVSNLDVCRTTVIDLEQHKEPTPIAAPTSTSIGGRTKKTRVCPPYKIVAGTTFAVDAFQFGQIEGVTDYFLTHFHADHYQGLTRKFSMPLYVSPLTARLVRAFIPIEEQYLHEIEVNTSLVIHGVEVTAIDANHCPGAVLFVFKLSTGRCILHTGDFRASPDMESEPIFWNNWIDTIYLDTTYIAHKNNFCSQYESIDRAKSIIEKFQQERPTTRILYICGSYVIGKERFWTTLAKEYGLKVWTEKNRLTALHAMDLEEVRGLLCNDPYVAQMHVISIGKVSYKSLVEYFRPFQQQFDAVLAFRPSGWEKNSKPSLRGQINIVGIEYSEHSSHAELERFVTYLKPRQVISTVPVMQGNPCITPKIPEKWYKYDSLKSRQRNFQPSITSFMKVQRRLLPTQQTYTKRTTNCVTPTKSSDCKRHELSQLSVRAMTTCVLQEMVEPDQQDVVRADVLESCSKASPAAITLFSDEDAVDDWIS